MNILEKGYRKELGWALVDFVKDRKKIEDTFPSLRFDIKDIGDATAEKKISVVKNVESLLNAYSSFMSNDAKSLSSMVYFLFRFLLVFKFL